MITICIEKIIHACESVEGPEPEMNFFEYTKRIFLHHILTFPCFSITEAIA